ncbi:MAG: crossover junction endodeoxyribonuclease RuvC [Clostridiaceae bacterium]|nr:crossover junction endodeoxyribonuclease RuvC [Clostridiaceae bacterium]
MIILGIDPGYAITGYAFIDYQDDRYKILDYGFIKTQAKSYFPERLLVIEQSLSQLIEHYKPEAMAIEELFFSRNTTTAIGTAQARGVIVVTGAKYKIPVFEYTPKQVKLAVTGYGLAEKQQVQEMVKMILKLKTIPKPDDVADAIAVAICHAHYGNRPETLAVGGYQ